MTFHEHETSNGLRVAFFYSDETFRIEVRGQTSKVRPSRDVAINFVIGDNPMGAIDVMYISMSTLENDVAWEFTPRNSYVPRSSTLIDVRPLVLPDRDEILTAVHEAIFQEFSAGVTHRAQSVRTILEDLDERIVNSGLEYAYEPKLVFAWKGIGPSISAGDCEVLLVVRSIDPVISLAEQTVSELFSNGKANAQAMPDGIITPQIKWALAQFPELVTPHAARSH